MPRLGLGHSLANARVSPAGVVSSYSLDFGGTDEWVSISDTNDLSFTDGTDDSAFSISAWIKIPDISGYDLIFSKYKDTSPFVGEYDCILSSGKFLLQILDGASNTRCYQKTDSALSTDTWHHVVATYDGTGADNGDDSITLYVDGSVATSSGLGQAGSYEKMDNTTSLVTIGKLFEDASIELFSTSKIDEVAVFGKALSLSEVQQLQGSGSDLGDATEISNLVGYWRMEEGSGTTVADSSGNGNDGTMQNMESGDWSTDGATN